MSRIPHIYQCKHDEKQAENAEVGEKLFISNMLENVLYDGLLYSRTYRGKCLHISEHCAIGCHAKPYSSYVSGADKAAAGAQSHKYLGQNYYRI